MLSDNYEALLSLQESRQALEASGKEKQALEVEWPSATSRSPTAFQKKSGCPPSWKRRTTRRQGCVDRSMRYSERDTLARQVADLTRERAERLEARKALESVHRALSQAVER